MKRTDERSPGAVRRRAWVGLLTGALVATGVGAAKGTFLGSVSSQVVRHAPCPVMLFRAGEAANANAEEKKAREEAWKRWKDLLKKI